MGGKENILDPRNDILNFFLSEYRVKGDIMIQENLYEVLRIPMDANEDIVKSAYYKKLLEMTTNFNNEYTIDDILLLNEAYRYLSNSMLRYIYNVSTFRKFRNDYKPYDYDDIEDLKICNDEELIQLLQNRIDLYNQLLKSKVAPQMMDYQKLEEVIKSLENNRVILSQENLRGRKK